MEREFGVRAKLGSLKWLTKKRSQNQLTVKENISGKQVEEVNTAIARFISIPIEEGDGFEFEDRIKGGVIPDEFIPSVEDGVREAMEVGILAGFPYRGEGNPSGWILS